jgi:hypothetical protein
MICWDDMRHCADNRSKDPPILYSCQGLDSRDDNYLWLSHRPSFRQSYRTRKNRLALLYRLLRDLGWYLCYNLVLVSRGMWKDVLPVVLSVLKLLLDERLLVRGDQSAVRWAERSLHGAGRIFGQVYELW